MICPQCGASNPDGKNYCGDCGVPLDPESERLRSLIDAQLEGAIDSRLRDREIVELQLTAAVADRLHTWAKVFAYWTGIPIALFVIVLGVLGFHEYRDIHELVTRAEHELQPRIERAQKTAEDAEQKASAARVKAEGASHTVDAVTEQANRQLASVTGLNNRLSKLTQRVGETETLANNATGAVRAMAASPSVTVPIITSATHAGSQATIAGANFGSEVGRVYLRVRDANTSADLVPEVDLKKDAIAQWTDRQILVRVPEGISSTVNAAKQAASGKARAPGTSSTFGIRYDYRIQTAEGKQSNSFTHSEFFINLNEGIGFSAEATK
ncbi:MAG: zinc-ribbon domain-containing protein [Terriglobales bacterium]|jgi:hypothetical protein